MEEDTTEKTQSELSDDQLDEVAGGPIYMNYNSTELLPAVKPTLNLTEAMGDGSV
jgi:hypothetical protein